MVAKFLNKISRKKLLFLVVVFFILLVYTFFQRADLSDSDIELSLEGPDTFNAEVRTEFEIKMKNESSFELQDVVFFVNLPEFLSFSGLNGDDRRVSEQKIDVGNIEKGSEVSKKFELVSVETGATGSIKVRAEYAPKNLQGRFERSASHEVLISPLPLTVIFDVPDRVVNGQKITGTAHFVQNGNIDILPLFAKLIVPSSFSLEDSEPKPYKENIWKFDDLESDKSYEIEFRGVMRGEENEIKEFILMFGYIKEDGSFASQYKTTGSVNISSSPMGFEIKADGKDEYIASGGEEINFSVKYENKSGVDIEDVRITVQLSGSVFDLDKLNTGSGFFNRNTRTIMWDKNFLDSLARLKKDDSGEVTFSVALKDNITPKNYRDKNIIGTASAVIESLNIPLALRGLSVRAEDEVDVKIRSSLNLFSRAYYYEGPFSNSGPIPPRVGEKTTYTILWQITNTVNDIRDARIEAPLPQYVDFEGGVYPPSSGFEYNENTHSVSWDIGMLSSGVGSVFPVETIAFTVSVTPTDNMRGSTFDLVEQSKISGTDTFTEEFLEDFAPKVSSSLPDDIGVGQGDGVVR